MRTVPTFRVCSLLELLKSHKERACKSQIKFEVVGHVYIAHEHDLYTPYWHITGIEKHFLVEANEGFLYLNTEFLYFSNSFGDFVGVSANARGRGVKAVYLLDGGALGWSESLLVKVEEEKFTILDCK